jgi:hypothetical protein
LSDTSSKLQHKQTSACLLLPLAGEVALANKEEKKMEMGKTMEYEEK